VTHTLFLSKLRANVLETPINYAKPNSSNAHPLSLKEWTNLYLDSVLGKLDSKPLRVSYELAPQNLVDAPGAEFPISVEVGQEVRVRFLGKCQCGSCGREVKKLFDGYCFPCLNSKAEADRCVMNPVGCHFSKGTCREPQWGLDFCYQPHVVYLSFTDKFKVGITRAGQLPTRWIDQGATAASPIAFVSSRHQAGLIEAELAKTIPDKSHWLKMLQQGNSLPLVAERDLLRKRCVENLNEWFGGASAGRQDLLAVAVPGSRELPSLVRIVEDPHWWQFEYPGLGPSEGEPIKIKYTSVNSDKNSDIFGKITGIKGQYLLLGNTCFNVRRHEGQGVEWSLVQ
jgi:hypothetical protein